ncbi:MAG: DUF488 domain-containing protein [Gammaproteobacteria bacterium]
MGELIVLLESASIEMVADVRRFPGSRRNPQFSQPNFSESLELAGIDYLALPELGGRRRPRADSPHTAWRNASFRGYADYMNTDAFRQGADRVIALAGHQRTALMCAEAVWWRCHRALIADYLKVRGHAVVHLLSPVRHDAHPYTSAASIVNDRLSYAAGTD